jgi:hypothetical protein
LEVVVIDIDDESLLGLFGRGGLTADTTNSVGILPAWNTGRKRRVPDGGKPGHLDSSDGRRLVGAGHLGDFQDEDLIEVDAKILVLHEGQLFSHDEGRSDEEDGRRELEQNEPFPQGRSSQHALGRAAQGQDRLERRQDKGGIQSR